jgi:hypothetical protein
MSAGTLKQAYRELDALAHKRYGISGSALLTKLEKGESAGRGGAVSSAGAKGWFQFMPATRQAVIQKYGIDPWRSEKEARDAAVLHLTGKLGNAKGLEGYNPGGGSAYVKYILGQGGSPAKLPSKAAAGGKNYGIKTVSVHEPGSTKQDVEGAIVATLMSGAKPQKLGATVLQKLAYDPKYAPQQGAGKTYKIGSPTTSTGAKRLPDHDGHGIVMMDGKPVPAWIAAELKWARAHGWKGTVSSGVRTDAEQTRIYKSGVRPAAVPKSMGGKGSNHEGSVFPLGAVDVTEAPQLAALLEKRGSPLKWAGSKDSVHFSHPHGGGY